MLDRETITAVSTGIVLLVSVAISYWLTPKKGVHETGIDPNLRNAEPPKSVNKGPEKHAS